MDSRIINNIIQFLNRTDLKWNEVPLYIECIQALNKELDNNNKTDKK
jgi:hypothetical protein